MQFRSNDFSHEFSRLFVIVDGEIPGHALVDSRAAAVTPLPDDLCTGEAVSPYALNKSKLVIALIRTRVEADALTQAMHVSGFDAHIECVATISELFDSLRNKAYDLALASIELIVGNAAKVVLKIRDVRPGIPFIAVGNDIDVEQVTELMRLGGTDFVVKENQRNLSAALAHVLCSSDATCDSRNLAAADSSDRAEREREFRQCELRYELASRATKNVIWDWDIATDRIVWNEALSTEYRYPRHALSSSGDWWLAHIHEHDRDRVAQRIHTMISACDAEYWSDEYRFMRADGTYATVLDRGYISRDPGSKAVRMIGAMEDVSEHRFAANAFRASEARFKQLFENAPVGIAEVDPKTLRFTRVNPKYCEMTGYTRTELEQITVPQLTHRDDMKADLAALEDLLRGDLQVLRVEKRYIRKDGAVIWAAVSVTHLRDLHGEPHRNIVVAQDITDRKNTERALKESEARFRTITEAMPQMVWSTLPDGYHDYYNERWYEFTGAPAGSTDGEAWNAMFHPDDQAPAWTAWRRSLSSGVPYEIEYRLRHRSGEYRWTLGRALPVRDEQGAIVRWMGTCTDIHEQKLRAQALAQALQVRDNFLAIASHELRTPLTSLKLQIDMVRRQMRPEGNVFPTPQKLAKACEVSSAQVKRLNTLIEELLDVSAIGAGMLSFKFSRCDLSMLVKDVIDQHFSEPESPDVHVELANQEQVFCTCDPFRIEQIIINLVGNACKYGSNKPIFVQVSQSLENAEVSVADSGLGIVEERLGIIFERFERAISHTYISGLGLGLYISRVIARGHQGDIRVESTLGRGSTFTLQIPLSPEGATFADVGCAGGNDSACAI